MRNFADQSISNKAHARTWIFIEKWEYSWKNYIWNYCPKHDISFFLFFRFLPFFTQCIQKLIQRFCSLSPDKQNTPYLVPYLTTDSPFPLICITPLSTQQEKPFESMAPIDTRFFISSRMWQTSIKVLTTPSCILICIEPTSTNL